VFDAVYNPPITRLLADAAAAGAQTVGGIEMFVRQAAAQFEAWTGKSAPAELMRRIVEHKCAR
jgi:shikimate 5-dehydrogenase